MALNTSHTVKCEKCSKTLAVSGSEATRGELYQKAIKAGWQWKSAQIQFCPDHVNKLAPKAAKSAKKSSLKNVIKKASVAKSKSAKKAVSPVKKSMQISGTPAAPVASEEGE